MTCRASSLLIFRRACSTSSSFLVSVDLMAAFRGLGFVFQCLVRGQFGFDTFGSGLGLLAYDHGGLDH